MVAERDSVRMGKKGKEIAKEKEKGGSDVPIFRAVLPAPGHARPRLCPGDALQVRESAGGRRAIEGFT